MAARWVRLSYVGWANQPWLRNLWRSVTILLWYPSARPARGSMPHGIGNAHCTNQTRAALWQTGKPGSFPGERRMRSNAPLRRMATFTLAAGLFCAGIPAFATILFKADFETGDLSQWN